MPRIKIKNFGPIISGCGAADGFLDIARVTAFIGSQGTGKSTITKLISVMTWLEKSLVRGELQEKEITSYNRFVKKYCAYQNIHNYFAAGSEIVYQGRAYILAYVNGKFSARRMPKNGGYLLPKIMYVPAERNFLSAVDRPQLLKNLPSSLYTFLDEFENAKRELGKSVELPVGSAIFEYSKSNKISFVSGIGYKIRLSEASSGLQSLIPLFLVTRYLAESIGDFADIGKESLSVAEGRKVKKEIESILLDESIAPEVKRASLQVLSSRLRNACFINVVEEPEQNLYPVSQKEVIFRLLEFVNRNPGNRLLLTTHSPYVVSYLSFAVKGYAVQREVDKSRNREVLLERLRQVIPLSACISPDDLAIYELRDDGTISPLEMVDGIPADCNALNQQLAAANLTFDQLLDIEESCR